MSGQVILVVGARGMGKTTTVKSLLNKVHPDSRIVLDVNGEYKDLYPRPFIGFESFAKMLTKTRKAFIVVEEATISLSNRSYSKDMADVLVRARHAENTIVLVYHSIRNIPRYIYDLANTVILLKTNDSEENLKNLENEKLTAAWKKIKNAPMKKNEKGREYSPQEIVYLLE